MSFARRSRLVVLATLGAALGTAVGRPDPAHAGQRITVEVNPHVELLVAVARMAGAQGVLPAAESAYGERIRNHFWKQRNAPAVAQMAVLKGRGFSLRDLVGLAIRLGPAPALTVPRELPPALVEHAGGRKGVERFVRLVRAFAKAGDFAAFAAKEKAFYDGLVAKTNDALGEQDWATDVEQLFGTRQAAYHLVISPLLPPETAVTPIATRSGLDVFVALGPRGGDDEAPSPGSADVVQETVVRELARPFFTALVQDFQADIRAFAGLMKDVAPAMKAIGVTDWTGAFVELGARAVAVRVVGKTKGDKAAAELAAGYEKAGFVFVPKLAARIAEYQSARNRYPDFTAFFQRYITVFAESKQDKIPPPKLAATGFDGTLLSALGQKARAGVLIVPPAMHPRDKLGRAKIDAELAKVMAGVRTRRGGFVAVLDERHAGDRNLKETLVLMFTTPSSSLAARWLPADRTPTFSAKGLQFAGKTYPGAGLQVVQAARGPADHLAAVVTMAAQPAHLIGAASCLPPEAAWAVCRDGKVIDKGAPDASAPAATP